MLSTKKEIHIKYKDIDRLKVKEWEIRSIYIYKSLSIYM